MPFLLATVSYCNSVNGMLDYGTRTLGIPRNTMLTAQLISMAAFAPLIMVALLTLTGSTMSVAAYMTVAAIITVDLDRVPLALDWRRTTATGRRCRPPGRAPSDLSGTNCPLWMIRGVVPNPVIPTA
ncbi:hypothetical protein AB0I53_43205 [Saccharopolyspora sp. NPDC050389]|uniref:hypothetical protein n=1 Tax=Saccharopolyspora sp. NPDC050389 TaxID=3155516 RepID=UPI0033E3E692